MTARRLRRVDWRRHGTTHRLGWGIADQAVSSLGNFAVVIFVARSLTPREFGIFSLAYVTYSFALNVSRGLATDPLVVRFSGVEAASWRRSVRKAAGTATTVGIAIGAGCALVGLALSGSLGASFLALAVVLPGLLLQDSWRYAFFAAGQGRSSFLNDLTWGLALIPFIALASRQGQVAWFVVAWGAAGCVAALLGVFQARITPQLSGTRAWLAQQRALGARYLVENLSMSAVTQLRIMSVGAFAGLSAVGSVRGAEVMLGPWLMVVNGLSMVAVPEAARALRRSGRSLVVFCTGLALVQAVGVAAWGLTLAFVMPDAWGHRLLGSLWGPASALVIPTTLAFVGISFMNGAQAGLRALAMARRSMRTTLVCAGAYLTGGAGGALVGNAAGSAWGVAGATAVSGVIWWWQFRTGLRDFKPLEQPDAVTVASVVPTPAPTSVPDAVPTTDLTRREETTS
jgi:O-antigen/teichoic acid export membrane protein